LGFESFKHYYDHLFGPPRLASNDSQVHKSDVQKLTIISYTNALGSEVSQAMIYGAA